MQIAASNASTSSKTVCATRIVVDGDGFVVKQRAFLELQAPPVEFLPCLQNRSNPWVLLAILHKLLGLDIAILVFDEVALGQALHRPRPLFLPNISPVYVAFFHILFCFHGFHGRAFHGFHGLHGYHGCCFSEACTQMAITILRSVTARLHV